MKEKIISQLRAKYPGVNLSQKRLDAIADKLTTKITDEAEIDGKLDELNDIIPFADLAKQDDRLRTLEAKTKPKPATEKADEPIETPVDDTPQWAKNLMQEVQTLKAEKAQSTMQSKLSTHAKLKDIPQAFYKGRTLPEKEEDLDSFADTIQNDYTAVKQELINSGLMAASAPVGGIPNSSTTTVDADISAWSSKGKESK